VLGSHVVAKDTKEERQQLAAAFDRRDQREMRPVWFAVIVLCLTLMLVAGWMFRSQRRGLALLAVNPTFEVTFEVN
jgi:hypothetical protein